MKKMHLLAALSLITVSGVAWAGNTGAPSFQDVDKNQDGQISRDEAKKSSAVSGKFDKLDTNMDGMLDSSEFSAMESMPTESSPAESGPQYNR